MPDIAALVTPPLLLDSTGAPANGDIFSRVTSTIAIGGGLVTPTQAHGSVLEGRITALDGTAYNLPVTPEGVAVELYVELREERPSGSGQTRAKHVIRRTVSVPDQSTVTWDELVDVIPVVSDGDYMVPTWVTELLGEAAAAAAPAIEARDAAIDAQVAAEAAAASVPSEATITSEISAAVAPKADAANVYTKAASDAAFTPLSLQTQQAPGLAWAFAGDSITNGSSAAAGGRYIDVLPTIVGTAAMYPIRNVVSETFPTKGRSEEFGNPGERSDQIFARFATEVLPWNPDGIVILAGTNDVGQSRTLTEFQTSIIGMIAAARQAGVPVVIGSVPPRGTSAATTTTRNLTRAYNVWLSIFCAQQGIPLAAVHSALADTTTGDMLAAYDSGDGIHPNTAGHLQIARAFGVAIQAAFPAPRQLIRTKGLGYLSNPLMAGAGSQPTSWFEQPGGTGTAPTYSIVSAGSKAVGNFAQIDFDAVAGGVRTLATGPTTTGLAAGDELMLAGLVEIEAVTGDVVAAFAAGTASCTLNVLNQSAASIFSIQITPAGTLTPGPIAAPFRIPAGTTGLLLWFTVKLPTGMRAKFRLAAADLINLTSLGILLP